MIATRMMIARSASPRVRRATFAIPDTVIRIYFALFPALIALFIGVQAVRAQIPDVDVAPASHIAMTKAH